MNDRQIQRIADNALTAAVSLILNQLEHRDGDVAAQFFSGDTEKQIMEVLTDYIKMEIELGQ